MKIVFFMCKMELEYRFIFCVFYEIDIYISQNQSFFLEYNGYIIRTAKKEGKKDERRKKNQIMSAN